MGDAAYEELELSIKTDGSINPEEAIGRAVDILISQLAEISTESTVPNKIAGHDLDMSSANRSLEECNLPSGTVSALKEKGITTVLELSNCTRKDLFEVPRVGLRKIGELERILAQSGLKLKSGDDNSQKRRKNQEEEI